MANEETFAQEYLLKLSKNCESPWYLDQHLLPLSLLTSKLVKQELHSRCAAKNRVLSSLGSQLEGYLPERRQDISIFHPDSSCLLLRLCFQVSPTKKWTSFPPPRPTNGRRDFSQDAESLRMLGPRLPLPWFIRQQLSSGRGKPSQPETTATPPLSAQLLKWGYHSQRSTSLSLPPALESWLGDFAWVGSRLYTEFQTYPKRNYFICKRM